MEQQIKKIQEVIYAIKLIAKYHAMGTDKPFNYLLLSVPDDEHIQFWREYDIWSRNFFLPEPNPNFRYFFYDDDVISLVFAAVNSYRDCHKSFEQSLADDADLDGPNNYGITMAQTRYRSGNILVFAAVSPLNLDLFNPAKIYSGEVKFPRSPFFRVENSTTPGKYDKDFLEFHDGEWSSHLFKVSAELAFVHSDLKLSAESIAKKQRALEYGKIKAYLAEKYLKPLQ